MPPAIVRHRLKMKVVDAFVESPAKKFKPSPCAVMTGRYADLDDPIEDFPNEEETKKIKSITRPSPTRSKVCIYTAHSAFRQVTPVPIMCSLTQ